MSKVKKDDKTREQVKTYLATGKSKNWIAKKLNISWDTVNRISKESPDEIANLREQKKQEFINKIWGDMESALALGRQKIKLATVATETFQEKIDRLIELLEDNEETNGKDIIELIKALSSITSIPLSHISTYFGTLYDKQALMSGEATTRSEVKGEVKTSSEQKYHIIQELISDEQIAERIANNYRQRVGAGVSKE